jgi:hypothetical protein
MQATSQSLTPCIVLYGTWCDCCCCSPAAVHCQGHPPQWLKRTGGSRVCARFIGVDPCGPLPPSPPHSTCAVAHVPAGVNPGKSVLMLRESALPVLLCVCAPALTVCPSDSLCMKHMIIPHKAFKVAGMQTPAASRLGINPTGALPRSQLQLCVTIIYATMCNVTPAAVCDHHLCHHALCHTCSCV